MSRISSGRSKCQGVLRAMCHGAHLNNSIRFHLTFHFLVFNSLTHFSSCLSLARIVQFLPFNFELWHFLLFHLRCVLVAVFFSIFIFGLSLVFCFVEFLFCSSYFMALCFLLFFYHKWLYGIVLMWFGHFLRL